ncbi:MAG: hypothetical protein ACI8QI_001147 [Limisphaerales bacterium]|jgi:hypothetical protein
MAIFICRLAKFIGEPLAAKDRIAPLAKVCCRCFWLLTELSQTLSFRRAKEQQ